MKKQVLMITALSAFCLTAVAALPAREKKDRAISATAAEKTQEQLTAPEANDGEIARAEREMHHGARRKAIEKRLTEVEQMRNYGEEIPGLQGLQLEMAFNRLYHVNHYEIEQAKFVEGKAKSPEVLTLAHRMRADHEALEQKINALAEKRNVKLESFQLATDERIIRDRLNKLSGESFDTAFLRLNDRQHWDVARELRAVRGETNDSDLRALINEALPQIATHRMSPAADKSRASTEESSELGK